ncbi:MAG TPA: peroxiredoxin [Kofleriaceae bacterium]
MAELRSGDPMPPTTLVGSDGPVELRDKIGKPLVVYFYPKDETYGCTKEACSFRDSYEDFVAAGADVIGISRDDAKSHAGFRANHKLPFSLLSDPDGSVAKAWGVRGPIGLPGRVTFVFDKAGVVKHRFESSVRFGKHVDEALAVVKQLAA